LNCGGALYQRGRELPSGALWAACPLIRRGLLALARTSSPRSPRQPPRCSPSRGSAPRAASCRRSRPGCRPRRARRSPGARRSRPRRPRPHRRHPRLGGIGAPRRRAARGGDARPVAARLALPSGGTAGLHATAW